MKKFRSISSAQRLLAFLFLLLIIFAGGVSWGQAIWTNPITGTNPYTANPYTNGQTVNSNITVSGIGRGNGITGTGANDRYNANSWNTTGMDNQAYFEFTVTPDAGYEIDFASFVYTGQASGTGANNFAFRTSADNFANNVGSPTAGGTTIFLSGTEFQNITSAIIFRLYGWGATASGGTFSVNSFTFNGTVSAVASCTTPTALAFDVQPSTVAQNATMTAVKVKAICSGGAIASTYTGAIKLKLNNGCGFEYNGTVYAPGTDISVNAVAGVATFSNIKFLRSAQTNLNFTATATGLTSVTSSNFNVTTPGGSSVTTTIIQNDFDANTSWAYPSIVSTTYSEGEGGVSEVGVVSQDGTNVLRKRHTSNNGSGETGSQSVITFDNVTGLAAYDELTFFFNVLSFGTGGSSSGAGNDVNEDFRLEISTNNGSTWTTILTEEGGSNRLFAQSSTPVTALSMSSNLILGSSDTKSAFKITFTGISQFRFRFTARNNRQNENWAIDNVKLTGIIHTSGTSFALPTAEIEAENAICNDGSGIQLSLDVSSFQPNLTYTWTPSATLVNATAQNPIANPTTATETYTVIVTDAHYCKATDNISVSNPGFGGTAGLWTGQFSTDWFDCRNWSDRKVPTTATAVTINQTASNECVIDEFDAVCNSLNLTSTNATEDNLTLTTTGKLVVSNAVSITNSGSGEIQLILLDNSRLTCGNLTIDGVSNGNAKLKHEAATSLVTVNGNLTIQPGGELDLSDGNNGTPGGIVHLKGNFINNATELDFKQDESTIVFNGTANQDISLAGTFKEVFYNLIVDKTSGTLTLSDSIQVTNSLTMNAGNINTQSTVFELGSSISNKGTLNYSAGFILGKMKRWMNGTNAGNASSLFPMGFDQGGIKNRNVSIEYTSAPTGGHLTVEFIGTNMGTSGLPIMAANSAGAGFDITSTENLGYWKIDPQTGTLNDGAYKITCTGEGFGTITDISKLTLLKRVVVNGPNWFCPGTHVTPTGTTAIPVLARSGVTGWSNFGFGGGTINPLPVELISFTASCGNQSLIQWSTASENNADYFSVEKTSDGINWAAINQIQAAGNTSQQTDYSVIDETRENGIMYYRLVQIDFDGTRKTYHPISLDCGNEKKEVLLFPNPNQGDFTLKTSGLSGSLSFLLTTADGKIVDQKLIETQSDSSLLQFTGTHLLAGIYFVTVEDEDNFLQTIRMLVE